MTQRRNRAARVYHAEIAKRSRELAQRQKPWAQRNRQATPQHPEDDDTPGGEGVQSEE